MTFGSTHSLDVPLADDGRNEMGTMTRAYIGLGANLGDRAATLTAAARAIEGLPRTRPIARSRLWRSSSVGAQGPDFLNATIAIDTDLSAPQLFEQLQAIEHAFGRVRTYRNEPRTLDLDLLLFGTTRLRTQTLTVPHAHMHERRFVLGPLADIDARLSWTDESLSTLLANTASQDARPIEPPHPAWPGGGEP